MNGRQSKIIRNVVNSSYPTLPNVEYVKHQHKNNPSKFTVKLIAECKRSKINQMKMDFSQNV
jgi:hypothetical protein